MHNFLNDLFVWCRILESEETNINLKTSISSNKRLAETQDEEFKDELRKVDRKTHEVLTMIDNLKVKSSVHGQIWSKVMKA